MSHCEYKFVFNPESISTRMCSELQTAKHVHVRGEGGGSKETRDVELHQRRCILHRDSRKVLREGFGEPPALRHPVPREAAAHVDPPVSPRHFAYDGLPVLQRTEGRKGTERNGR